MKKLIYVVCGLLSFLSWTCNSPPSGQTDILLSHINLIDVANGMVVPDQDVIIRGDTIAKIVPGGKASSERVTLVYRGDGKYLIPGLWDMHTHADDPEVWRMNPVPSSRDLLMPLFVLNGVTGIRDMGGDLNVIKDWRRRGKSGELLVPEIVACGPLLDGPNPMWDGSVGIDSPEDVPHVVDSLLAEGIDFLKVYSLLPRETYFALAEYANSKGIPFVGHVPLTVRPSETASTGMKSQEHLLELLLECSSEMERILDGSISFKEITDPIQRNVAKNRLLLETFDEQKAQRLIDLFAEQSIWHTPTISMWFKNAWFEEEVIQDDSLLAFLPSYLRKYWQPEHNDHLKYRDRAEFIAMKKELVAKYKVLIKMLNHQGIPLLAGTDTGANPLCFPGWSLHWELEMLEESGLLPEEALRTATLNPAVFLGIDNKYGSVAIGKKADLVILDADPLRSISNTQRIDAVIKGGVLLTKDSVQQHLQDIKKANQKTQ